MLELIPYIQPLIGYVVGMATVAILAQDSVDVAKLLIGGGAGAGTFAFFAWIFYKNFVSRVDKDIDYLKQKSSECDKDREALHAEIREMQQGVLKENTRAFRETTATLQRLFQKLNIDAD